jgi:hypothetical protein
MIAAVALIVSVAATASARAATITVIAERRGDTRVQATAMLNADATTAWHVLTDYNRYAEFIPTCARAARFARVRHGRTVRRRRTLEVRIPIAIT